MSDYMFMLESHITGEQARVLAEVRAAAEQANLNIFLTGGAMRDMMGGFPIRDLDFTVEGTAVKFAKDTAAKAGAQIVSADELHKSVELNFPGGVTASIGMARQETYAKPGGRPQVQAATIHEDLHGRDFTVDAIALSLGNASRGLLLDPTNGLGDLTAKELRAASNHALYDDPSRILRMFRLKARLGFSISERTLSQYANVREAKLETKIPGPVLLSELRKIASDPAAAEILRTLEEEHLSVLFSPALTGAKLNLVTFQKLHKILLSLPPNGLATVDWFALTLFLLLEQLNPKERTQMVAGLGLEKAEVESALKLDSRAKKVEKELAVGRISKPSVLYGKLSGLPGETLLFLLLRSGQRMAIERVRNYLQKYLPLAQEVTEKEVAEAGGVPGTPKYEKLKLQLIAARLDARPKKPAEEEPPPPPPVTQGRRPTGSFARPIS